MIVKTRTTIDQSLLKRYLLAQNNEVREIVKKALKLKGIELP
jgi:hypothetical protein